MKITMTSRIVALLTKQGPCSVGQVYAELGRFIDAATAIHEHRRSIIARRKMRGEDLTRPVRKHGNLSPVEVGRRRVIARMLNKTARYTKTIRMVAPGVYDIPREERSCKQRTSKRAAASSHGRSRPGAGKRSSKKA